MGMEGIGASVVRKEDKRFITGKGRYTDDIRLHGMTHAHFIRSPHAHAKVKGIDSSEAMKMPGVVAVLTGKELVDDKIGNLICGWMIHSKDGSPMKMGAFPALAPETVRFVGQAVAVVIADSKNLARDAAEKVNVTYEELPAVPTSAPRSLRARRNCTRKRPATSSTTGRSATKRRPTPPLSKAANVVSIELTNNRLVPNAMEPRSAIADYDTAEEHFTLYTTSQNPHVARLVLSAFYNIAPEHKLRVIAPDVGGGFGSKIFIYPEEMVALWASKKVSRPVKWTADRTEAFLTDAHGRDHLSKARDGVRQGQQDHRAQGQDARELRRLHVAVLVVGADLSLRDAAVGPVHHPEHLLRGDRRLHQHHAGRRLSRRGPPRGELPAGAADGNRSAQAEGRSGRAAAEEFHHQLPVPDAGDHGLRRRRL